VSRSSYYDWLRGPSLRDLDDANLLNVIHEAHVASRKDYDSPRIHAELKMGLGVRVGKKPVARLMRLSGLRRVCRLRKGLHLTALAVHGHLVKRRFITTRPNQLWCIDVTEHPTREGRNYCCEVLNCFSRRIVGWAIAAQIRPELVVDAVQMAKWNRLPEPGTVVDGDRGSQCISWIFGQRRREARLLGSMERVASSVDNTMMESFWSTMQREVLDRQQWDTRNEPASANFEWIGAFHNPIRRHTSIGFHSPAEFETRSAQVFHAA